ncbi:hypothetical protein AAMO2058_000244300 [Amorphochlora amoebiformis]
MMAVDAICFALGLLAGVMLMAWRSYMMRRKRQKMLQDGDKLVYLNVVILNKKEAVHNIASEKVPRVFRGAAARIANSICTESKFSQSVGEQLAENIPRALAENQIYARCACVYNEGPLCIVRIRLLCSKLNLSKILTQHLSQRTNSCLQHTLELLGLIGIRQTSEMLLRDTIVAKVEEELKVKLPREIEFKMDAEKGIKVDVIAVGEKEEAEWFFAHVQVLRQSKAKKKPKEVKVVNVTKQVDSRNIIHVSTTPEGNIVPGSIVTSPRKRMQFKLNYALASS